MSIRQVDISEKDVVLREAEAEGFLRLREGTIRLIKEGKVEKGDVISVAKVAGITLVAVGVAAAGLAVYKALKERGK